MSIPPKREAGTARPAGSEPATTPVSPSPAADPTLSGTRSASDAVVDALGRFGTDRLGDEQLETDRLLAIAHRHRSPEARLQAALRSEAGRLLANWIVRIANLPVYRAQPNLRLDQLMDGLPAVVHAMLQSIGTADPAVEPEPGARAVEVAAAHARRRAQAGFPVGAVLAELRELHAELLTQLWRLLDELSTTAETAAAPRSLIDRLAAAIGELQIAAADAWTAVMLPAGGQSDEATPPAADGPRPREGHEP
jgi:hypothetical protein